MQAEIAPRAATVPWSCPPRLSCVSFDLPVVEPIAQRSIEAAGVAERVSTTSGDFFADPLPDADVITMGLILHDWNLENKMHLVKAAYDALPEGGAFIAIENLIDDARRENADASTADVLPSTDQGIYLRRKKRATRQN